ncbi:MAG: glycosyltransferase family 2 protein [Bacteroidales bacterium]|nr:glycosyltransferase family 2 protein [Bacteroidales bacterium]
MSNILNITDWILFLFFLLIVLYLLVFSLASLKKRKLKSIIRLDEKRMMLVLFPAYKEDEIIIDSVKDFLKQDYPPDRFEVVVISDKMRTETNDSLKELSVTIFEANYENSTKAKALNLAIDKLGDSLYDVVVVMDADNKVETSFLTDINHAFCNGSKAVQAHRTAKNLNTSIAILDAISEEINNSIFRKGHINFGLSAALIGSGMAFEYNWFRENIKKFRTMPEERELEALLLKQRIFIDYLENVLVYDEKIQKSGIFYKQRRRWFASQIETLKSVIWDLPSALFSGNISYADKIIQWLFLPRLLIMGFLTGIAFILALFYFAISIKWFVLLFLLLFSLIISIPAKFFNKRLLVALWNLPYLFILMFLNIFKVQGVYSRFIHTEKNYQKDENCN